jgi:lipoprotein-anchoring transpeptidase ErfK/SrfK
MSMQRAFALVLVASALGTAPVLAEPLFSAPGYGDGGQSAQAAPYAASRPALGGGLLGFIFSDTPHGIGRPSAAAVEPRYAPVTAPASGYAGYPAQESGRYSMDPRFERQVVDYSGAEPAGTIVIDTRERFLYLVESSRQALRYGIGVGRPGFAWAGTKHVSMKREWPDWVPPDDMLRRRPDLPRYMPGGPENPLGARALYLGSSLYRIHGSNEPWTIGTAVSSGCIRMRNQDVIDLYDRVKVGTKVVVI